MSMTEPSKQVLLASEWLDQDRLGDPMKARIVMLLWVNLKGEPIQISTNEQWQEGTMEEAKVCKNTSGKPNYAYGHYFTGETEITQAMLADFYKRCGDLFRIHFPK